MSHAKGLLKGPKLNGWSKSALYCSFRKMKARNLSETNGVTSSHPSAARLSKSACIRSITSDDGTTAYL